MKSLKFRKIFVVICILFFYLLQNCSSQDSIKENRIKENMPNRISKQLPNGMVELSCKIIKLYDKDGKKYCSAKVSKVHGYGSSVKALSEKMVYEFEIADNIVKTHNLSSYFNKDMRCKLINSPAAQAMGQVPSNRLKIVSITNR